MRQQPVFLLLASRDGGVYLLLQMVPYGCLCYAWGAYAPNGHPLGQGIYFFAFLDSFRDHPADGIEKGKANRHDGFPARR